MSYDRNAMCCCPPLTLCQRQLLVQAGTKAVHCCPRCLLWPLPPVDSICQGQHSPLWVCYACKAVCNWVAVTLACQGIHVIQRGGTAPCLLLLLLGLLLLGLLLRL